MRDHARAALFWTTVLAAGALFSMSAHAQFGPLERVILPGPVISAHADVENECETCHVRFSRGRQRDLCLECHTEIAEDLDTRTGFHSLSPDVGDATCASCHTEHEGRDADVMGLNRDSFDHGLTDFALRDAHLEVVCDDCHVPELTFHDAGTQCIDCHQDDDQHLGNLGEECSDCHRETRWADWTYDHELENDYALLGAHADIMCTSCHVDEHYVDTPNQCVDCHRDDDEHMGTNGTECQDCHNSVDWADTTFDHFARTNFALADGHSGLMCEDCHQSTNKFDETLSTECVSCHIEDDAHDGINGEVCNDCHRPTEWLDVSFDHDINTDFPLDGAHADIECADCHIDPVATALPATECIGCHADDEPHEGQLGEACDSCHAEVLWTENVRFDHDLTVFPLLGKHDDVVCEDCHATQAYHDAPEICVDCHAEDDVHEATLGDDCALCHSPVDWTLWRFDHDVQTSFPLDGAHSDLACGSCHREPAENGIVALPSRCVDCHRRDDVHRGEFGDDCAECHLPTSFDSLRPLR